jgi:hypothetical protein
MSIENGYHLEYTGLSDLPKKDIICANGQRVRLEVRRQKRYFGRRVILVADLLAARGLINSPSNRYRKYTGPIDARWAEGSFIETVEDFEDVLSSIDTHRDSGDFKSVDWNEFSRTAKEAKYEAYPPVPETTEEVVDEAENGPDAAIVEAVEAYMEDKGKHPLPGPLSKRLGRSVTKAMIDTAIGTIEGG